MCWTNSDSVLEGVVDRKVVVPLGAEEVHEAVDLGVEGCLFGEVIGKAFPQFDFVGAFDFVVVGSGDSEGKDSHDAGICW